jgi:putative endonuclease
MNERYAVYVLASQRSGTLCDPRLCRAFHSIHEAIAREMQIKGWNRAWKLKLIEASNPNWHDLDPTAC